MQINRTQHGKTLTLELEGRLDAFWADHVQSAISDAVHEGHHHLTLNMKQVDFVSSAGIGVLLKFYKQLAGINGSLSVVDPSPFVAELFNTMGLRELLAGKRPAAEDAEGSTPAERGVKSLATDVGEYEIRPAASSSACQAIGDPSLLATAGYTQRDWRSVAFPRGTFAIGIGAPGRDFGQCAGRLGDFLAADGAVAFLPTDPAAVPDFLLVRGDFVPSLGVVHCIRWEGAPATTVSFQARPGCSVSLSELAEQCLAAVEGDAVGLVAAAEADGLVGASLRRSPVAAAGQTADPFAFPQVRDWMKFTAERAFASEVAIVVGVAARTEIPGLTPSLRLLGPQNALRGHFHAAAFSYHPLRKTDVDLSQTIHDLFERERLRGLLHLVNDTRPINGVGQSEFVRGTCWAARIEDVENLP